MKNKRKIIAPVIAFAILIGGYVYWQSNLGYFPEEWVTYRNDVFGFSFDYPKEFFFGEDDFSGDFYSPLEGIDGINIIQDRTPRRGAWWFSDEEGRFNEGRFLFVDFSVTNDVDSPPDYDTLRILTGYEHKGKKEDIEIDNKTTQKYTTAEDDGYYQYIEVWHKRKNFKISARNYLERKGEKADLNSRKIFDKFLGSIKLD